MIEYAEGLLCSLLPERDPLAEQAAALVARITDDPGLRRVERAVRRVRDDRAQLA